MEESTEWELEKELVQHTQEQRESSIAIDDALAIDPTDKELLLYRLAPEYPFPTAVEDSVDAVLYLIANSQELGINPRQIATSGFSAGGSLAFTVPLKLQEIQDVNKNPHPKGERDGFHNNVMTSSPVKLNPPLHPIVAIAAWYPVTDVAMRRPPTIPPVKSMSCLGRHFLTLG